MKYSKFLALALITSLLFTACLGSTPADEDADTDAAEVTEDTADTADAEDVVEEPAELDESTGLSTGTLTELIEGDRPTLVDKELGYQVTCPPDVTWSCKLNSDGTFKIKDMSANKFEVRAHGDSSMDNAIEAAMAIAEFKYAEFGVEEREEMDDGIILNIGPDPSWSEPVDRQVWIVAKEINGTMFTCEGFTNEKNYENTLGDFEALCDSLAAAE
jgi:PBP1b-binding outer membrane lipoprotein LpoB